MAYKKESELYPEVVNWLQGFLEHRYSDATIRVEDLSRTSITEYIRRSNLQKYFPSDWVTWDIQVDVVGFIYTNDKAHLVFVECKLGSLNLMHLSQLIGYSRVAKPSFSFLISPVGISNSLLSLLETYNRKDVLEYHWPENTFAQSICVSKWDKYSKSIDLSQCIRNNLYQF